MTTSVICAHVRISGKVQGVGFRFSTLKQAQKLGVNGWVKNLPDRRVEALFEGDRLAMDKMLQWCSTGSVHAVVQNLEVEMLPPTGINGFEIR